MAKIKKSSEDCIHAIYPLGKGLPFCTYNAKNLKNLEKITIKDFPVCKLHGRCYKKDAEKEKNDEA